MPSIPTIQFEKSTNYLNTQLEIQLNNQKLVSTIISNINLILDNASKEDALSFSGIQKTANDFLENISNNITIIEELNRQIKHITSNLEEILEVINQKEKSKEYCIAAISTIKDNIENYTVQFQAFEQKLNQDNIDFNDFVNNCKLTLESYKETVKTSDFSTDTAVAENADSDSEVSDTNSLVNDKDAKINELTNEFRSMLLSLSDDALLSLDLISVLKNTFSSALEEPYKQENSFDDVESTDSEEIEEETNSTTEINYSNIYDNYYTNNTSSIEEDFFSEYSNYTASLEELNTKKENRAQLFILNDTDDDNNDVEVVSSTENEVKSENSANSEENLEDETIKNEFKENLETPAENNLNDIIISDSDLANEILCESLSDSEEISISDSISDDDILSELLASNEISDSIIFENEKKTEIIDEENNYKMDYDNILNSSDIDKKIQNIKEAKSNNDTLIISEKEKKVFLPYTIDELENLLREYPAYYSIKDLVEQEYVLPYDMIQKHPKQCRFFEAYNLIKNRENKSTLSAILYGLKLLFNYNLNPAIIAACKNQNELESYMYCLNHNKLKKFKSFKTIYQINPL